MTTLTQIRRFIEGTDLLGEIQQDVLDIESGQLDTITQGWDDLAFAVSKENEFGDLFSDPYSMSKSYLSNIQGDAETYLKGITLTVQAFDGNGDTNLMNGNNQATMFDFVTGGNFTVTYNWVWNEFGSSDMFSANWGSVPEQNLSEDQSVSQDGIILSKWGTAEASGSAAQWMPYVHTHGGDDSALNRDSYIAG